MIEILRATGRTTRLIEEAKRLREQGKPVAIVAGTVQQVHEIKRKVGLKIPVFSCNSSDWSWSHLRHHALSMSTDYLIDHSAIESRYANELKALHRFDPPIIKVG